MSGGNGCECMGSRKEKMKNWRVVVRNGNYSSFEKPRGAFHTSEYSSIICLKCGALWRTKANYVPKLEDCKEGE